MANLRIDLTDFNRRLLGCCKSLLGDDVRSELRPDDLVGEVFQRLLKEPKKGGSARFEVLVDGTLIFRGNPLPVPAGKEGDPALEAAVAFAARVARNCLRSLRRRSGAAKRDSGGKRVPLMEDEVAGRLQASPSSDVDSQQQMPDDPHFPGLEGGLSDVERELLLHLHQQIAWIKVEAWGYPAGVVRVDPNSPAGHLTGLQVLIEALVPFKDKAAPREWKEVINLVRKDRAKTAVELSNFVPFLQELQSTRKEKKALVVQKYLAELRRWAVRGPDANRNGKKK